VLAIAKIAKVQEQPLHFHSPFVMLALRLRRWAAKGTAMARRDLRCDCVEQY
jgi:hypothetical protein